MACRRVRQRGRDVGALHAHQELALRTSSPRRTRTSIARPDARDITGTARDTSLATTPVTLSAGRGHILLGRDEGKALRMLDIRHATRLDRFDDRRRRRGGRLPERVPRAQPAASTHAGRTSADIAMNERQMRVMESPLARQRDSTGPTAFRYAATRLTYGFARLR